MADALGPRATAVSGTFSAAGQSSTFTPISEHIFNVTLVADGSWSGSVQLERQLSDGATWVQAASARTTSDTFNCMEAKYGTPYRLNCTSRSAGSMYYEIVQ